MTFDERIDKLTERHEALAQSLELLALQTEQDRKNIAETRKDIQVLVLSIRDLVSVVRSHEHRIAGLEG